MLSNNNLIELRRRQIDTLKIFNNNVTEIKKNEEYSIGFISDGRQSMLNVYLTSNFPNEKPHIVVKPLVQHKWIPDSATGEIKEAPGLLRFTVHSDLGRVVHAIIREFEKYPPPLWSNESTHSITEHHSTTETSHSDQSTSSNKGQSNIRDLCNLTVDDLQKLDTDLDYLNDFVDEIDVVQHIQNDLNGLIADVQTIANENLSREQYMQELRTNIEYKLATFRKHGDSYEALSQRYQTKSEEFAPQHIKELLQIAGSTSDSICDRHVEEFLKGSIDVQTFIDRYKDAKQISAMRKAKEERLSHQLNELERATF